MRIFIAGATGVLGRRVVKRLVAEGHHVAGLSRSGANTAWMTEHGAEALPGDLFNSDEIRELTAGYDAILHLATAIPTKDDSVAADWAINDRIRREGTAALVDAAVANGCQLYVQQSITFLYGDQGDKWVDESTPLPQPRGGATSSAVDMENMVFAASEQHGLSVVNLRFGSFYSADSAATQSELKSVQKGLFPVIDGGTAYWSLIHVDDAAAAVVSAVDKYPAGIGRTLIVCDDEPVMVRDLAQALAADLDAPPPRYISRAEAESLLGAGAASFQTQSLRCRNDRVKEALGWTPHYPTYREGYPATIAAWREMTS